MDSEGWVRAVAGVRSERFTLQLPEGFIITRESVRAWIEKEADRIAAAVLAASTTVLPPYAPPHPAEEAMEDSPKVPDPVAVLLRRAITVTEEAAARTAHEVNRAYCDATGDHSQVPWEVAPAWQRESAIIGVIGIADGRIKSPGDSHRSWLEEKSRDGWRYGLLKDPAKKEHPCIMPFEKLPLEQQVKDHLFLAAVRSVLALDA